MTWPTPHSHEDWTSRWVYGTLKARVMSYHLFSLWRYLFSQNSMLYSSWIPRVPGLLALVSHSICNHFLEGSIFQTHSSGPGTCEYYHHHLRITLPSQMLLSTWPLLPLSQSSSTSQFRCFLSSSFSLCLKSTVDASSSRATALTSSFSLGYSKIPTLSVGYIAHSSFLLRALALPTHCITMYHCPPSSMHASHLSNSTVIFLWCVCHLQQTGSYARARP